MCGKEETLVYIIMLLCILFAVTAANANQLGVNLSEGSIGALVDYKKEVKSWEFEGDSQIQRTDVTSFIVNGNVQYNFGIVGIKPFLSYNRDEIGYTLDAGMVINFSIFG